MINRKHYKLERPLSEGQAERLLDDLSAKLGFCLSNSARIQLIQDTPLDAKEFADAIFVAEGMEPQYKGETWRRVVDIIQSHFQLAVASNT